MKRHDYRSIPKAIFHSLLFFSGIGIIMALTLQVQFGSHKFPWLESHHSKELSKIRTEPPLNFQRKNEKCNSF